MLGYRSLPATTSVAVRESGGLGVAPQDSVLSSEDPFRVPADDGWLEPLDSHDGLSPERTEPQIPEALLASLNLPSNQLITPQIKVLLGKVQKSSASKENPSAGNGFKNENYLAFGGSKPLGSEGPGPRDSHPHHDQKPKKGKQTIPLALERVAAPWISSETAQITNSNLKLHNEIMEFCLFIEPKEEERARQKGALEE